MLHIYVVLYYILLCYMLCYVNCLCNIWWRRLFKFIFIISVEALLIVALVSAIMPSSELQLHGIWHWCSTVANPAMKTPQAVLFWKFGSAWTILKCVLVHLCRRAMKLCNSKQSTISCKTHYDFRAAIDVHTDPIPADATRRDAAEANQTGINAVGSVPIFNIVRDCADSSGPQYKLPFS